ncbi:hypothetical protein MOU93_003688 [Vibrio parahaemolyticus]|nr:hypothetical protein [Vibrio parahaemolyticus]
MIIEILSKLFNVGCYLIFSAMIIYAIYFSITIIKERHRDNDKQLEDKDDSEITNQKNK